jgi:8-oxo-dGTP pyrophosphatase MutT (NUDIX family)
MVTDAHTTFRSAPLTPKHFSVRKLLTFISTSLLICLIASSALADDKDDDAISALCEAAVSPGIIKKNTLPTIPDARLFNPYLPITGAGSIPGVIDAVVVILQDENGHWLMNHRRGKDGGSKGWAFLGGKRDPNESIIDTAEREVFEEAEILIHDINLFYIRYSEQTDENRTFRVFFVVAKIKEGTPLVVEPDKSLGVGWFSRDALPGPLYAPNGEYLPEVRRELEDYLKHRKF